MFWCLCKDCAVFHFTQFYALLRVEDETDGRICLKESFECNNTILLYAFVKFLLRSLKCSNSKIKLSW